MLLKKGIHYYQNLKHSVLPDSAVMIIDFVGSRKLCLLSLNSLYTFSRFSGSGG